MFPPISNVKHSVSALVVRCRSDPIFVAKDRNARAVGGFVRFISFSLDEVVLTGDEILELALGFFVARPKGLVEHDEQRVLKMAVELPGEIPLIGDDGEVRVDQEADALDQR
ncbi:MAG: hypothetical protein NUV55_00625, partial [Sulfuricaulis sp.]|nr:hypothetical protein [Sulfuricaulis sp.]